MEPYLQHLLFAWGTYLVGAATPGPATMAIAEAGMSRGRGASLALAAGVVSGSLIWGLFAVTGFAVAMATYGWLAQVLRIVGGLYLLYLAYSCARVALAANSEITRSAGAAGSIAISFRRGLLLHLTNPKAVFSWLAVVAVGVPAGAPVWFAFVVLATCDVLGMIVFGGYALLFSTRRAQDVYRRSRRAIEAAAALAFGAAGAFLLARRIP